MAVSPELVIFAIRAAVLEIGNGSDLKQHAVKKNWPAYDGVLMDLIIDYLTYVFIPAFALFKSGLLTGWTGWISPAERSVIVTTIMT